LGKTIRFLQAIPHIPGVEKYASITSFPNKDGSFSALLILPLGKNGLSSFTSEKDIEHLFTQEFPALLPLPVDVCKELLTNPEGNFVTVHTDPWYYKDLMALVGDAAHGFYPFLDKEHQLLLVDGLAIIE